MPESDEYAVDLEQVQRVLSARAEPFESWDPADSEVLSRYHEQLTASRWADNPALNEPVAHEAIVQLVAEDDSLRAALKRRLPGPAMTEELTVGEEPPRLRLGCTTRVAAPPYPIGYPLQEEFGDDATVVEAPLAGTDPTPSGALTLSALAQPGGMKTFSRLAVPAEGALSLAVALGKLRISGTTHTIHPPRDEYPQTFPVPGGSLEVTGTGGFIGYLFQFAFPGAGLQEGVRADATVDLSIGSGNRPFDLMVPPGTGEILQAFGVADAYIMASQGVAGEGFRHRVRTFLEHREGPLGPIGTPIVRRQLRVRLSLLLPEFTWWVYVGVMVRLEAQRWFILPPPAPADRDGFVGIDLRAPQHDTHSVHALLEPNGPVTVRSIELNLCKEPASPLPPDEPVGVEDGS